MSWFRRFKARLRHPFRKSFSEPNFWDLDHYKTALGLSSTPDRIRIENDVAGYAEGAYKANGVVFACSQVRQLVFSEARFLWRDFNDGITAELSTSDELDLLENPWPGGTTGELLAQMDLHVTIAGNFFATTADDAGRFGKAATGRGRRITVLRPDWVTIVLFSASGDPYAADTRIAGYLYEPPVSGVSGVKAPPLMLMPEEVCHYSPYPDPLARFRGMSWLTPVLREVSADLATTKHKQKFFEQGATLQTIARLPVEVGSEAFEKFVQAFQESHQGSDNAYKTLFLGGGADLTVVGADLRQLDFKAVQGAGETRVAAASGIHPVIVGLSEGLAGSALNAGNFNSARRLTADKHFRPHWRMAAASLQRLVSPPSKTKRLWYDDSDIAFLREDLADLAEIQAKQAEALRSLVDAGFDPDSAADFLRTNDLSRLQGNHSGLFSVQLQPPGPEMGVLTNGNGNGSQAALTR